MLSRSSRNSPLPLPLLPPPPPPLEPGTRIAKNGYILLTAGCFVRKVGQIFWMVPSMHFCARSLADSIPDDCVGAESSTLTAFILGEKRKETIKWLGVESAVQIKLNLDSCLRGLGGSGGRRGGGGGRRGGRRRGEAGGERGEVLEVEPELVLVESVKIVWVSLRLI